MPRRRHLVRQQPPEAETLPVPAPEGDGAVERLVAEKVGANVQEVARGIPWEVASLAAHRGVATELTHDGLAALNCGDIEPTSVQKLDSIDALEDLQKIGTAVAARRVAAEHFNFDIFKPT